MNNAQLINQTSGNFEYYTPKFIVEAARQAMGSIDLDPASSYEANKIVRAWTYFDESSASLLQPWWGNVWLNHPFSRGGNALWINKLVCEYESGRVGQACCITYACTSEKWFQPLFNHIQCFLSPRTNYLLPDGTVKKGVTKGSVVTYFGKTPESFIEAFQGLGAIK